MLETENKDFGKQGFSKEGDLDCLKDIMKLWEKIIQWFCIFTHTVENNVVRI